MMYVPRSGSEHEWLDRSRWQPSQPDLRTTAASSCFGGRSLSAVPCSRGRSLSTKEEIDSTTTPSATSNNYRRYGCEISARKASGIHNTSPQTIYSRHTANHVIGQLEDDFNNIINDFPDSLPVDWGAAANGMDQLMWALSHKQDDLSQFYSDSTERSQILASFLQDWQARFHEKLQSSEIPKADADLIFEHFKITMNVMLKSMIDDSRPSITNPLGDQQPGFYMEQQVGLQCGRHAANAFFGQPLMESTDLFQNVDSEILFEQMQSVVNSQPHVREGGRLVKLRLDRFEGQDGGNHFSKSINQKRPVLESLDQINRNFILLADGHYVCFKKDDNNQWWVLDSLRYPFMVAMNPSNYIDNVNEAKPFDQGCTGQRYDAEIIGWESEIANIYRQDQHSQGVL
ncbi:hypothetical protein ACH42_02595 [Endozoicomonas sp. (ex Bugula neritina AB1)]|nr:hypothetical protein ACH42_02595 [Endozoicomonas sp. (ex Bugula neritina AB1)]